MAIAKSSCLFIFFIYLFLLLNLVDSECENSFTCGKLGSLQFPLARDRGCGLFLVDQCDSDTPRIQLQPDGRWYDILRNGTTNSLVVRDPILGSFLDQRSCFTFENLSFPRTPYSSFTVSNNLTLFTCFNTSFREDLRDHFENYTVRICDPSFTMYYRDPRIGEEVSTPTECSMSEVPMKSLSEEDQDWNDLFNLLSAEYTLEWHVSDTCYSCHYGGGQCLTNPMNEFVCKQENKGFRRILLIGAATLAALASTAIIMIVVIRRKFTPHLGLFGYQKAKSRNEKNIELFLKNYGNLAPIRYTYTEIKKMTTSFRENLGKGGYGTVYKGKLPDGRLVAVKVLNESKENGEEFMNEVASISRTSHINIVTLLGFCFEGSKRALIYEFMPNGSLEKFIKNTGPSSEEVGLGWQVLLEIALGIARGLEYLHHSCNMRILHFDIKPHNILLDKNFNPRISDFGLAKLCPNRSSIVSMMVARGTIGYIAPEVFCRNFGEVSHKSDVYSFGMMVLEITGGRKNIDRADVDHTSEIYFPHYIYKQLEVNAERDGIFDGTVNEEESLAERKLIIVGLWCIQTDPRDRPSMTKVVEMLEGRLESLQVPPKPYLSSPPRAAPTFSSSESL